MNEVLTIRPVHLSLRPLQNDPLAALTLLVL